MTRILRVLDSIPARGVLWSRVQLARSILSHRPWCDACRPHADQTADVLAGKPPETLANEQEVPQCSD